MGSWFKPWIRVICRSLDGDVRSKTSGMSKGGVDNKAMVGLGGPYDCLLCLLPLATKFFMG